MTKPATAEGAAALQATRDSMENIWLAISPLKNHIKALNNKYLRQKHKLYYSHSGGDK